VNCDDRHLQLSSLIDSESGAVEQAGLFAHLDACAECRRFLDTLLRARDAARRDRAELLREAEELLPRRAPMPAALARQVAGIAIGAGLTSRPPRSERPAAAPGPAARAPEAPTYVYVCSLPEYEVIGNPMRRATPAVHDANPR
jgi:hypothetical protein